MNKNKAHNLQSRINYYLNSWVLEFLWMVQILYNIDKVFLDSTFQTWDSLVSSSLPCHCNLTNLLDRLKMSNCKLFLFCYFLFIFSLMQNVKGRVCMKWEKYKSLKVTGTSHPKSQHDDCIIRGQLREPVERTMGGIGFALGLLFLVQKCCLLSLFLNSHYDTRRVFFFPK